MGGATPKDQAEVWTVPRGLECPSVSQLFNVSNYFLLYLRRCGHLEVVAFRKVTLLRELATLSYLDLLCNPWCVSVLVCAWVEAKRGP